jgi:O-antigen/teichoic acid export membrane protein
MLPIGLLAPELVVLFAGAPYEDAVPSVGLLLVQAILFGLFTVANTALAMARRMHQMAVSAIVASAVAVLSNIVLAPAAGSAGTAGALALGQAAGFAYAVQASRRAIPVPFAWGRIAVVTVSTATAIALATLVPDLALAVRLAMLPVVVLVLWVEGSAKELAHFVAAKWRERAATGGGSSS